MANQTKTEFQVAIDTLSPSAHDSLPTESDQYGLPVFAPHESEAGLPEVLQRRKTEQSVGVPLRNLMLGEKSIDRHTIFNKITSVKRLVTQRLQELRFNEKQTIVQLEHELRINVTRDGIVPTDSKADATRIYDERLNKLKSTLKLLTALEEKTSPTSKTSDEEIRQLLNELEQHLEKISATIKK